MCGMLADLWPLYGLTVATPRLELRLPREEELAELADLAGRGVHPPGERPFLTPWTEGGPAERARFVLHWHWHQLASWEVASWELGLGVFLDRRPIGWSTSGPATSRRSGRSRRRPGSACRTTPTGCA
jgi:hypothetical protein